MPGSCRPYLMDFFFEIFTSGRHHRDMKALKILASKSKNCRIHGTFNKWQIGVPRLRFSILLFLIISVSNNLWPWKFTGYGFLLKKFKNDIEIALKHTGFELQENPVKIYHSLYICKRKRTFFFKLHCFKYHEFDVVTK